jgi:uncharacterized protein YeaO (DUF488 family)
MRVLVDRLWPRGVSRESARIDFWAKEIAPSHELRKWFHRDTSQWNEFKLRYYSELDAKPEHVQGLIARIDNHKVTFLFASKEADINHAVALRDYLRKKIDH